MIARCLVIFVLSIYLSIYLYKSPVELGLGTFTHKADNKVPPSLALKGVVQHLKWADWLQK